MTTLTARTLPTALACLLFLGPAWSLISPHHSRLSAS